MREMEACKARMRSEESMSRQVRKLVSDRIDVVNSLNRGNKIRLSMEIKRYLADRSPLVRAAAIDIVREENLREFMTYALQGLSDKNYFVRYSSIECLGALHEGEGIRADWLYPLLQDTDPVIRVQTIESLGQIGDKESLNLIAEKLDDRDPLVRAYAAQSIAELDGKQFITAIEKAAKTETDDSAKVGFANALFSLGDEGQFFVLLGFLSSSDYRVRCASANVLSVADLTSVQLKAALEAVSYAARHALAVADRSTMEHVQKKLRVMSRRWNCTE